MTFSRRTTLAGIAVGAGAFGRGSLAFARPRESAPTLAFEPALPSNRPFQADAVRALAESLARSPYRAPVPQGGAAAQLDYDGWRRITYRRDRTRWAAATSRFRMQYFPTGYLFRDPVRSYEVTDGRIKALGFEPADFDAPASLATALQSITDISGFRLQSPINKPDVFDEIAVFQGASYFRSLGENDGYGLSARGISLGTGEPNEEFPAFRAFWIETPEPNQASVVIHALLDGPSLTGAYRFTITPGLSTVFDVEARLYPRRDITNGGLAPQSSMFLFGAADRRGVDDFRGEVHDSDGLEIWTGAGERIWRPLTNPDTVQITDFPDVNPRGFGLSQRDRVFDTYNDLEARYDRRPSLWVEPVGAWGAGAVHLAELPAKDETVDNIALFWRPAAPWKQGQEVQVAYRLYWGDGPPLRGSLGKVVATRTGQALFSKDRQFVVDFQDVPAGAVNMRAEVSASSGEIGLTTLNPFPDKALVRAAFRFTPPPSGTAELQLRLVGDAGDLSESWRFRWT